MASAPQATAALAHSKSPAGASSSRVPVGSADRGRRGHKQLSIEGRQWKRTYNNCPRKVGPVDSSRRWAHGHVKSACSITARRLAAQGQHIEPVIEKWGNQSRYSGELGSRSERPGAGPRGIDSAGYWCAGDVDNSPGTFLRKNRDNSPGTFLRKNRGASIDRLGCDAGRNQSSLGKHAWQPTSDIELAGTLGVSSRRVVFGGAQHQLDLDRPRVGFRDSDGLNSNRERDVGPRY